MEEALPLHTKKVCFFSQRFITILMISIGVCLHYLMRQMNEVVLDRWSPYKYQAPVTNRTICGRTLNITSKPVTNHNLYNWNRSDFVIIRDSFWLGYIVSCFLGGIYSDKRGGKNIVTLSTVTTCIVLLLTPTLTKVTNGNYKVLAAVRVIFGFFTGPIYSATNTIISFWVPACVRGRSCAIVYSITPLSVLLSNVLTNAIIEHWNSWESVFYFFPIVSLVWVLPWSCYCFSNPWENPYMDEEEFNFLDNNLKPDVTPGSKPIPWISLLTCIHLYPYLFSHCSHIGLWHAIKDDIPLYMTNVLKIDLNELPGIRIVPLVFVTVVTNGLGYFADYLVVERNISLTSTRKILTTFGLMGPAVFGLMALYSGCVPATIIVQFSTGFLLMSCHYIGTRANSLDLAPNFSGVIMGLSQVASVICYLAIPDFVQTYILTGAVYEWKYMFWGHLIATAVVTTIFVMFASAEVQDWNREEDEEDLQSV